MTTQQRLDDILEEMVEMQQRRAELTLEVAKLLNRQEGAQVCMERGYGIVRSSDLELQTLGRDQRKGLALAEYIAPLRSQGRVGERGVVRRSHIIAEQWAVIASSPVRRYKDGKRVEGSADREMSIAAPMLHFDDFEHAQKIMQARGADRRKAIQENALTSSQLVVQSDLTTGKDSK